MAQVVSYNLTIDDTSPQIAYLPATLNTTTPNLSSGWNQYFNGVGFNTFPGEIGFRNASLHLTQMDGANFSIAFTGTAIELYGLAIQSAFSIVLDDESTPSSSFATSTSSNSTSDPSTTLLASFSGLSQQDHIISFTAHTTNADSTSDSLGMILFDRAVVTVSTGPSDAAITTTTISDTQMQFRGSWSFVNNSALIPDGDHSCHITQAAGDQAQYSFKGSSIELGGLTNASAGLFNISLTSDANTSTAIRQQQLSGFSSFLTYTTLFTASGLNADAMHTLTITNAENKTLALNSMNITVMSGGQTYVIHLTLPIPGMRLFSLYVLLHLASHAGANYEEFQIIWWPLMTSTIFVTGLSRGAVAGIAVASSLALLFLIGILALLLFCWRRRRHCITSRQVAYDPSVKPQPLHRRVGSVEVVPISPRWPGRGPNSPQTRLVGTTSPEMIETTRVDEDVETDSGIGHVREKNGSVNSISYFNNVPREQVSPTRKPARHRSFALARWSGWFTSSSPTSSHGSRRSAPSPQNAPIVSPRPVRVYPPPQVLAPAHLRDGQDQRSSSVMPDNALLDIPRTSPFEVDFEKRGELRPPEPSDLPRSRNSGSLGAQAKDMLVSFLDFASSGAASLRESTRSRSRRPSTSIKSSSQSANEHQARSQQESSGQSQTASTGMWTLSLSVDPPARPARESHELVPRTAVDTIASTRHPFSLVSADLQVASPDSPTDSLPMSVSDINFRNDEDSESPVVDRGMRFHLPRHPPLPGTPHSYTFTSNNQSPEFVRASHMRQMSAPNLGSMGARRPYVAQTSFGRRLAQVRAQADSQASISRPTQSESPSISEQPVTQPPSSRLRTLPLPFIHFGRSASGS
ncbi:hypothetical protein ACEPAF_7540 [Sanghuangporus sanghuang]